LQSSSQATSNNLEITGSNGVNVYVNGGDVTALQLGSGGNLYLPNIGSSCTTTYVLGFDSQTGEVTYTQHGGSSAQTLDDVLNTGNSSNVEMSLTNTGTALSVPNGSIQVGSGFIGDNGTFLRLGDFAGVSITGEYNVVYFENTNNSYIESDYDTNGDMLINASGDVVLRTASGDTNALRLDQQGKLFLPNIDQRDNTNLVLGFDADTKEVFVTTSAGAESNVFNTTIQANGGIVAPDATISANSIVGNYITGVTSAAIDSLNANQINATNIQVSGDAVFQTLTAEDVNTANVSASIVFADDVLAKSLDVSGPATFNGVTTVSVLKFTPGGIDPAIASPVAVYTGTAENLIHITATGVTYGSATVDDADGTVTGLSITDLAPNAHLYIHVKGLQTFAAPTDGYTYLSTVTGAVPVMYHVFNVGGTIFVDMTQVNSPLVMSTI